MIILEDIFLPVLEKQLFEEYLKGLPRLLVDEKFSLESELLKKQQKIEELESKENEIKMLKQKMDLIQAHLENIQLKS